MATSEGCYDGKVVWEYTGPAVVCDDGKECPRCDGEGVVYSGGGYCDVDVEPCPDCLTRMVNTSGAGI